MAKTQIDKALLDGIMVTGSKPFEVNDGEPYKNGDGKMVQKKKTVHQAFTRQATPEDVLDWTEKGDSVAIVTRDGEKHSVAKKKRQ